MFTWYITLYTILVQKWGVGAYMVMGAYKVLYSICRTLSKLYTHTSGAGDQNGTSPACYIVDIYHSGQEPLNYTSTHTSA